MINIIKTEWIRSENGLKQMNINFSIEENIFNWKITKNSDINKLVNDLDYDLAIRKKINNIILEWYTFNVKQCEKIQRINLKMKKLLMN